MVIKKKRVTARAAPRTYLLVGQLHRDESGDQKCDLQGVSVCGTNGSRSPSDARALQLVVGVGRRRGRFRRQR